MAEGFRFGRALVLVAALAAAACASRPATEATGRFAAALATASTNLDGGLASLGERERRQRALGAEAAYLDAAPGTRRASVVLPARGATNADVARGVLAPGFDLLTQYAVQLTYLSSGEAMAPVSGATDALRSALKEGLEVLGASRLGVGAATITAGKEASEVILAIIEFTIERTLARDLAAVIDRADRPIAEFAALLKAVVGVTERQGLRLTLDAVNRDAEVQRRVILGNLVADQGVSRFQRREAFRAVVTERDDDLSQEFLSQIVAATDRMVQAHRALRRPAEVSTRRAIEDFAASVERLAAIHRRLGGQDG